MRLLWQRPFAPRSLRPRSKHSAPARLSFIRSLLPLGCLDSLFAKAFANREGRFDEQRANCRRETIQERPERRRRFRRRRTTPSIDGEKKTSALSFSLPRCFYFSSTKHLEAYLRVAQKVIVGRDGRDDKVVLADAAGRRRRSHRFCFSLTSKKQASKKEGLAELASRRISKSSALSRRVESKEDAAGW